MLRALELANFKAFGSKQRVPLAPITLLFGPNSAGKSSIIHSLALIHEAERQGNLDVHRTEVGGSSIDIGGFRQYIFRRDPGKRVEWGVDIRHEDLSPDLRALFLGHGDISVSTSFGVPVDDYGVPLQGARLALATYEISVGGAVLLKISQRHGGVLRIDAFNADHPVVARMIEALLESFTTTSLTGASDRQVLWDAISRVVSTAVVCAGNYLPIGIEGVEVRDEVGILPISRGERHGDLVAAIETLLPRSLDSIVGEISRYVRESLNSILYLGPFRTYPSRHFAFDDERDSDWRPGGAYSWNVLRTNQEVRDEVNQWLGGTWLKTPYELQVRRLVSAVGAESDIVAQIDEYLLSKRDDTDAIHSDESAEDEELLLALNTAAVDSDELAAAITKMLLSDKRVDGVDELVLIDRRTDTVVSHRDVGIGVSQILPVLVSAMAETGKIIAIEQPEVHIHPALQAELADVFIESALGSRSNSFIIETHSEHMMLRILRRIRETSEGQLTEGHCAIAPTDVSVVYVEPTSSGAIVKRIPITSDGDFEIAWPHGFFPERARELF